MSCKKHTKRYFDILCVMLKSETKFSIQKFFHYKLLITKKANRSLNNCD